MAIITISRLYGSGGSEVAALVARALNWTLLDNAFVDQVASRLGITPAQVAAREERVPSLVERITDALALGSQEWITPMTASRRGPTDEQLVEVTRHVVEEAIASGPLVIVGRGAQAMLAERADALHVFCHARKRSLIKRAMERDKLNETDATRVVEETNAHREAWVRRHFDRDWMSPVNYHLSVNTGLLGIQSAADLVVSAARACFNL